MLVTAKKFDEQKSLKQKLINFVLMCKTEKCLKIIVGKIMCKK